jgi:ABC-type transport system involved in multi-copper enzyme maturation permease subunit
MNALLIARNTYREATRDRVLAGMTIAGVVFLVAVQGLTPLALGEGKRLVVDMGLSAISMLGLLVVLMVGSSLVATEIERRTIYTLLARPIPRPIYLIGKWAGLTGSVCTITVLLGLALWLVLCARGLWLWGPSVLEATYLASLELAVITAVAVMFSALSTPVLSALYTLGFFCAGQWSYDLHQLATQFPGGLRGIIEAAASVLPNLPLFNMRGLASQGLTTTPLHLAMATGYAALYCACVLALAAAAFESRDFK